MALPAWLSVSLVSCLAAVRRTARIFVGIPGIERNEGFRDSAEITNNTDKPIVLQEFITIASSGLPFTVVGISPAYCTVIPVNGVVDVIVYANSDNSANTPVTLDVTVPWGHDCDDTDHPPIVIEDVLISAFPPCSSRLPAAPSRRVRRPVGRRSSRGLKQVINIGRAAHAARPMLRFGHPPERPKRSRRGRGPLHS